MAQLDAARVAEQLQAARAELGQLEAARAKAAAELKTRKAEGQARRWVRCT